ncbi:helix-turn-helix transcriptional regulator [Ideonella sp.]|jgi:predicted DNA-binding transcriptional regulator AlpA|uniref:helix-turn-helix transcriptional regulator n=1 Tax=Ideonella sp. TaxID=1929293 RepID=UPI0037BF5B28
MNGAFVSTPTRKSLRVKEARAIYGVSVPTLYRLAARGLLSPVKVGTRCTLWPVEQLDALFVHAATPQQTPAVQGPTKTRPHTREDVRPLGAA